MNTRNSAIDFRCNFEATYLGCEPGAVRLNTNKICLTKKPIHLNGKRRGDMEKKDKKKSFASCGINFALNRDVVNPINLEDLKEEEEVKCY